MHSALDLVSAVIAVLTMREALKPADSDHPFGHGKIETMAAFVEAVLLVVAAIFIAIHAYEHWMNPRGLSYEWVAVGTMAASLLVSFGVYHHNIRAAQSTGSTAVYVNAIHFLADILSSAGVLIGLLLEALTGWVWLDPLIAFGVAGYVVYVAVQLLKSALSELVDVQLPEAEVKKIRDMVFEFKDRFISMQNLRTRKSGAFRHVDFHLLVCGLLNVNRSHQLCDEIEEKLQAEFPNTTIKIHVEPCSVTKTCEEQESTPQCSRT